MSREEQTAPSTPPSESASLQRYGILMSYLQYENTMYWQRASFFLVASTALFGFFATRVPSFQAETPWDQVGAIAVVGLTGIGLSVLWGRSLDAGEYWVTHWHSLLQQLEPQAFGDLNVLRGTESSEKVPKRPRARVIPRRALALFYTLWSLLLAYGLAIAALKLLDPCFPAA